MHKGCQSGYTAYASKPDCGIGKKAEQNGTVNGKGCYRCVDETSSDCSRGKLEKDLETCVDGKTKKEVGSTNSGLKCYECVDDVCPTGYTSDSESCKNSQNTGYAVLQEGVETPSGGLCYTCGLCQTGYQYQNSTPNDTECTHWKKETDKPCYISEDTDNVSACPNGGTQTPCGDGQKETGRYENICHKTCYKCEADEPEAEPDDIVDPVISDIVEPVSCNFDMLTLASAGGGDIAYRSGEKYFEGPLYGRLWGIMDKNNINDILKNGEDKHFIMVFKSGTYANFTSNDWDKAKDLYMSEGYHYYPDRFCDYVNCSRKYSGYGYCWWVLRGCDASHLVKSWENPEHTQVDCSETSYQSHPPMSCDQGYYFQFGKYTRLYGVLESEYSTGCGGLKAEDKYGFSPICRALDFKTKVGNIYRDLPVEVKTLSDGHEHVLFPKGHIMAEFNREGVPEGEGNGYSAGYGCDAPRKSVCPKDMTPAEDENGQFCRKQGDDRKYASICQCSGFEVNNECDYCQCISDVAGRHIGRKRAASALIFQTGNSLPDEVYYDCGCLGGTKTNADSDTCYRGDGKLRCVCPPWQKWDPNAARSGEDDVEEVSGACVDRNVASITVTPQISANVSAVKVSRGLLHCQYSLCTESSNCCGKEIEYTFDDVSVSGKAEISETATTDLEVYIKVVGASYQRGSNVEEGFKKVESNGHYKTYGCTIQTGEKSCNISNTENEGSGDNISVSAKLDVENSSRTGIYNFRNFSTSSSVSAQTVFPIVVPDIYVGVRYSEGNKDRAYQVRLKENSYDDPVRSWFGSDKNTIEGYGVNTCRGNTDCVKGLSNASLVRNITSDDACVNAIDWDEN